MSETARPADLIRDLLYTNVVPTYKPAFMWDDSEAPFKNGKDSHIIVVTQSGGSRDGILRNADCQVSLFSPVNSTPAVASSLIDTALQCQQYLYDNPYLGNDGTGQEESIATFQIEDVSTPLKTADNRYLVRFTFEVIS